MKIENSFWTNLKLLGFDEQKVSAEHGMSFHKDMFHTANQKGSNVILHFLLCKVDESWQEEFRGIWPVYDKEQAKQFKQLVFKKLEEVEKHSGNLLGPYSGVRVSILNTCSGDKFYYLLWQLSNFILKKQIQEVHKQNVTLPDIHIPNDPTQLKTSFALLSKALKVVMFICN